jgi:hypothetical protein
MVGWLLIVLKIYVVLFEECGIFATQPVLAVLILSALLAAPQEERNQMSLPSDRESSVTSIHFTMANCDLYEIFSNLINF